MPASAEIYGTLQDSRAWRKCKEMLKMEQHGNSTRLGKIVIGGRPYR
jgi:hypothetical protein